MSLHYIDCHYQSLFDTRGNGWTGGDATYSTTLPDGRRIWLFGDTFLGTVNEDYTRPGGFPLINNTLVVETDNTLTTLYGGTEQQPEAYIKPPQSDDWYWPNDPTVVGENVQLLLSHMGRSGTGGMWDFHLESIDLAIISLADLSVSSVEVKIPSDEIYWGACVMEDVDYTYIYGVEDEGAEKFAHVARAAGGDLTNDWEFFNGTSWQVEPTTHRIQSGVSNQFSVFKRDNTYYLLTQRIVFGSEILLFESSNPTGPWTNERTLYCTPELGGNIFTYNAFAHPDVPVGDDLFISYNVNSFNFGDLFDDVRNYRPRFIRVKNWQ